MKQLLLQKGKEKMLERKHPWVFSGALTPHESIEEGALVQLTDFQKKFVATGFYQTGSIAIRIITWQDEPIDLDFFKSKIESAWRLREEAQLISDHTSIFRLFHGEGDGLGGLIMDVYDKNVVIQGHAPWVNKHGDLLLAALMDCLPFEIETVYYKDPESKEGHFLLGSKHEAIAHENGIPFRINWVEGQKTGFFIDQRDNRLMVEKYANRKKVLNLYAYTGGFSSYALRGGASEVISVDSSQLAIDTLEQNINLLPKNGAHESVCEDVKKFLSRNQEFDLIIHDPPAFAKHHRASHNALMAYTRLNQRCMEMVRRGGYLFTFSCSQAINWEMFEGAIRSAAMKGDREVQIIKRLGQGMDHPVSVFHSEGEYLKGFLLRIT